MSEIRIPTQKRSIEKKDKIVAKGFELMCENGYFNTSTNDIAKYAGVSTGIIYQYFNDKKEIFIEGVKNYSDTIMFPILDILKNNNLKFDNLDTLLDKLLDSFINKHTLSKKAHEEMMALSHLDEDIAQIFHDKEMVTTKGKNGTGLGLYMSYSTIKAHFNGNITFDTKKGKGTKFNIYIPM